MRILLPIALALVLLAALVYAGDYLAVRVRVAWHRDPFDVMEIQRLLAVRLKGKKMVLWDFPECKVAVISISYVHMYLSENVEKSVKQCVRPLRFPSTSLR